MFSDYDAIDVNSRRMHDIWVKQSGRHDFFNFSDRDPTGFRHLRIEVSRGHPVDEIALRVSLPSSDECNISPERCLKHVPSTVKLSGFLSV